MPKYFPGGTSLHAGVYSREASSFRLPQQHLSSDTHDDAWSHSLLRHSTKTQLQNQRNPTVGGPPLTLRDEEEQR